MRRMIGIFGMSLPIMAVFWTIVLSDCTTLLDSISAYYHTDMRNVFVGILCAVSFFLFAYHGYNNLDFITFKLAAIFSLGIAFFPTKVTIDSHPCIKICGT
jgi:formate hydrogenlyase subunit 4